MDDIPVSIEEPVIGGVALLVCAALVAVAAVRKLAVPRAALGLGALGGLLLALAAGDMTYRKPAAQPVQVLVDLSPSTREADFRNVLTLERQVKELLGPRPYEFRFFAEEVGPPDDTYKPLLQDLVATRTVLPQAEGPAVLLFSDGRFAAEPAAMPPVYVVIDPRLEQAEDAAVTSLDGRGGEVVIGVRNAGVTDRPLWVRGVNPEGVVAVARGSFSLAREISPGAASISAVFAPGDGWPENDALHTVPPPPATAERWWVGRTAPDASWRALRASDLPADAGAFLAAAVVVLDNVPAESFDDARQLALRHYVRDLGGSLVILGGDRAFAAGGYAGTALDELSPLASTPPEAVTHWVMLADASGSMNQPAQATGGRTRWQYAADAVAGAVKQLPPADLLSVGSFAAQVRWWSRGGTVADARAAPLPPADVQPRGQTNLDAALREVVSQAAGDLPTEFLVATDAQAEVGAPDELAKQLRAKRVRLHVLLIGDAGDARGAAALRSVTDATGGTFRAERLPENWAAGLRELLRAARPAGVVREPIRVRFVNDLALLGGLDVPVWNRTWPKSGILPLAEAEHGGNRLTAAARWNVGEGRVAAAAFSPPGNVSAGLARIIERPPRDPRFRVTWDTAGSTLRVAVDAVRETTYINGQRLTLELDGPSSSPPRAIPQTGPGRYELTLDAPRQPSVARVRRDGDLLDARALAGRYAAEFDTVGNDRAALAALAGRTGGAVVEPGVTRRLDLPRPRRRVPLVSFLATAGAALVAAGLVRWRIGS